MKCILNPIFITKMLQVIKLEKITNGEINSLMLSYCIISVKNLKKTILTKLKNISTDIYITNDLNINRKSDINE